MCFSGITCVRMAIFIIMSVNVSFLHKYRVSYEVIILKFNTPSEIYIP